MNALFAQAANPQAQQQQLEALANELSKSPVGIAAGVLYLVSFVLLIWVIVVMFQNNQTALGIITILTTLFCGIGPLIAFIMGWVKSGEWKIRNLMIIWTLVILAFMGTFGYFWVTAVQQAQQILKP